MNRDRFRWALEWLEPARWKLFEEVAAEFMAARFPELRTTASATKDRGRDGELWTVSGDPSVLLQYSVAADWEAKVQKTVSRIKENFPRAKVLVYVTNQAIGAQADDLVTELRKQRIMLDVCDQSWLLDRRNRDLQTEAAAERLAEEVVDPVLRSNRLYEDKGRALAAAEARTALVFLGLYFRDASGDKGLTKVSFEALTLAALRDSSPDDRINRREVYERVKGMLPHHDAHDVSAHVDRALLQMDKSRIRHHRKTDDYCLSWEERERLDEDLLTFQDVDRRLMAELRVSLEKATVQRATGSSMVVDDAMTEALRDLIERVLLQKGEEFVHSVKTGEYKLLAEDNLDDVTVRYVSEHPAVADCSRILEAALREILLSPPPPVQAHIRQLANAYTLFAFLRETPDVQKVLKGIFGEGDLWLDTTVVLPLFAEQLLDESERRYSTLVIAARQAGMNLWMTEGVLEELERHINRALTCSRQRSQHTWEGRIPFLYASFIWSGRDRGAFPAWLQEFRGYERPEDDIAEFLEDSFGIRLKDLADQANEAPDELKRVVLELWRKKHETRRPVHTGSRRPSDTAKFDVLSNAETLAKHDFDQFLGVATRRKAERAHAYGYTSWWLTIDRDAAWVSRELMKEYDSRVATPIMSPDFLVNYLALGPLRGRVSASVEHQLPVMLDVSRMRYVPQELVEIADEIRASLVGLPERVIRRRVRDSVDTAKAKIGTMASGGTPALEEGLKRQLLRRAKMSAQGSPSAD